MKIKQSLIVFIFAFSQVEMVFGGSTTFGSRDCAQWLSRKDAVVVSLAAEGWLAGYMTGLNVAWGDADPLEKINSGGQIDLWMDNYCQKNPLSNIFRGGQELILELARKKK